MLICITSVRNLTTSLKPPQGICLSTEQLILDTWYFTLMNKYICSYYYICNISFLLSMYIYINITIYIIYNNLHILCIWQERLNYDDKTKWLLWLYYRVSWNVVGNFLNSTTFWHLLCWLQAMLTECPAVSTLNSVMRPGDETRK